MEDSTRGSSIINPLNYKGDVLVQVWMDSRILATLSNWLDGNETYTRYMSQVVRRPCEVLIDNLVTHGDVVLVDDTAEARRLLERKYGVKLNRGNRGGKNVLHNKILSDRRVRLADAQSPMRTIRLDKQQEIEALTELYHKVATPAPIEGTPMPDIVGDDWVKGSQERDKKIAEQENAPIDTSGMKFAKLDDEIV